VAASGGETVDLGTLPLQSKRTAVLINRLIQPLGGNAHCPNDDIGFSELIHV